MVLETMALIAAKSGEMMCPYGRLSRRKYERL